MIHDLLNKVREFLSRRHYVLKYIYVIIGIVFILTTLKISGSSIGIWDKYISGEINKDNVIAGIPRTIRSDEWLVATPLLISQAKSGFEVNNKNIGLAENTSVIYDAPNKHWSTIFKPHNWSFFFLPLENAFAFKWWFRGGLLIISSYLLLLLLTNRNINLSIAGSLMIFFTPMVQWWYAIQIMEPLAYGFLALYFAIRIQDYESIKRLILYSIFLYYSMVAFALAFYPAFQIPIIYVLITIFLTTVIQKFTILKKNLSVKFLTLVSLLILSILTLYAYYQSNLETINTILNSSYPGSRFENGGNYNLLLLLSGPFSFLLQLNSISIPNIFGNQTEGSNFIFIVPGLILSIVLIVKFILQKSLFKKYNIIFLGLILLNIFILTFQFIGFPDLIAKYSLLYLVPENRSIIALGLSSFFIFILFINEVQAGRIEFKDIRINYLITICLIIFISVIGLRINMYYPEYTRNLLIVMGTSLVFGITLFLVLTKKIQHALVTLVLICFISAGAVNPLYIGLKPLYKSDFSTRLNELNNKYNPDGKYKWATFDNIFWGNFLISQGIPTLNGTHLYPQLEIWKPLDTENQHLKNYNRYSHIIFNANENNSVVSFENPSQDSLQVNINPCHEFFTRNEVILILSESDLSKYTCLREIESVEKVRVYERLTPFQ